MKKVGVLLVGFALCLLFLNIFLVHADLGGVGEGLEQNIEDLEEKKEKIEEFAEGNKWDYLGKEWQSILLKNKIVAKLDDFFKEISVFFEVLFGEPYSLSITLLVIILLWLYLFFKVKEILGDFGTFSSGISLIMSFLVMMLISRTNVLRRVIEFFGYIVFIQDNKWVNLIMALLIIIIMFVLYKFSSLLGEAYKEEKERLEKEKSKQSVEIVNVIADAYRKMFGKK